MEPRNAIVTGASHGIGQYIARALAARHMNLLLVARSEAELARLATELETDGGKAAVAAVDLGDPGAARQVAEAPAAELGTVDVLVNNAATEPQTRFHVLTPAETRNVLQGDRLSPLLPARLPLRGHAARQRQPPSRDRRQHRPGPAPQSAHGLLPRPGPGPQPAQRRRQADDLRRRLPGSHPRLPALPQQLPACIARPPSRSCPSTWSSRCHHRGPAVEQNIPSPQLQQPHWQSSHRPEQRQCARCFTRVLITQRDEDRSTSVSRRRLGAQELSGASVTYGAHISHSSAQLGPKPERT